MFHHSAAQAQLIQISPTRVIHFSYLMMYLELPQNAGLIFELHERKLKLRIHENLTWLQVHKFCFKFN